MHKCTCLFVNCKIVDKLSHNLVDCDYSKPQKQQNLLFSFFVDFRKAFDHNYTPPEAVKILMNRGKKVFKGVS